MDDLFSLPAAVNTYSVCMHYIIVHYYIVHYWQDKHITAEKQCSGWNIAEDRNNLAIWAVHGMCYVKCNVFGHELQLHL